MASTYHPLYGGVWQSAKLEGTPFEEKGFFIYLFGNDHQRPSGIYRLTDQQAACDTFLSLGRVRNYFSDLDRRSAIVRDASWVFVLGYFERQPKQQALLAGASRDVAECSSERILRAFGERYSHFHQWSDDRLATLGRRSLDGHPTIVTTEQSSTEQSSTEQMTVERRSPRSADNGQPSRTEAAQVLTWLNEKAGRNYRPVPANLDLIVARLQSGISAPQLKAIVSRKVREWNGDPKMRNYLRPETLFGKTKCEQYVGELPKLPKEKSDDA